MVCVGLLTAVQNRTPHLHNGGVRFPLSVLPAMLAVPSDEGLRYAALRAVPAESPRGAGRDYYGAWRPHKEDR